MQRTSIPYCDYTSNPLYVVDKATGKRGWACTKVSQGCRHCYAERINQRFGTRILFTEKNRSHVEWRLNGKELEAILRLRKPSTIFMCDMTDLFHPEVPDRFIVQLLDVTEEAPQHTYLFLTKRAKRMQRFFTVWYRARTPAPNCWLGTSAENQHWADLRIPLLLATPAAHRWASLEPLLGPVDLVDPVHSDDPALSFELGGQAHMGEWDWLGHRFIARDDPEDAELHGAPFCTTCGNREANRMHPSVYYPSLDVVVVGGESGPGYRLMPLEWVRDIKAQCDAAGVAYYGKQAAGTREGIPLPGELGERAWPP